MYLYCCWVRAINVSVCVRNITILFGNATQKFNLIKKCFIALDIYVNCILLFGQLNTSSSVRVDDPAYFDFEVKS